MDSASALDRLDSLKTRFSPGDVRELRQFLETLGGTKLVDAASLIRFHEILLFVLSHPASEEVRSAASDLLDGFSTRIHDCAETEPFEEPEVSGIAGTSFSAVFTRETALWLSGEGYAVDVDWERYEHQERLGAVLPPLIPRATEDTLVEANVPCREWVENRRGKQSALAWLASGLSSSAYELLQLPVRWELDNSPATRTLARIPARRIFCHDGPLIRRADVSLDREIECGPAPMERVSQEQAGAVLALARATSAARYRELHGFTYPDPAHVYRCEFGRGVEFFVWGVPPEHRLPLRAYHCGLYFKNGVPLGYVETLSLFDRCEVGFNLYYTFRDGEAAWIYAKLLSLFRRLLGTTCFVVDPYQIGMNNEEAIESGAFWFYRKLGFRPADPEMLGLAVREERRIRGNRSYRSTAATLRRLAVSPLIYELPGVPGGEWDHFQVRRLAMSDWKPPAEKQAPEEITYLRRLQSDPEMKARAIRLGRSEPAGR